MAAFFVELDLMVALYGVELGKNFGAGWYALNNFIGAWEWMYWPFDKFVQMGKVRYQPEFAVRFSDEEGRANPVARLLIPLPPTG